MIEATQIREAIERARLDPGLHAKALDYYAQIAPIVLRRNHERKPGALRASDAGRCSRELWADLNGKLDLREDAKGALRMDNGTLMGAWFACLLKVGLEAVRPELLVELELTVEHDGTPGHVDATIDEVFVDDEHEGFRETQAAVEFKWSAWTGDWRGDCKPFQRDQSGKYGLATDAPQHLVTIYYASSPDRLYIKNEGWIEGNYLVTHAFETAATEPQVEAEYARLSKALAIEMPEPDPPEGWRCKVCRFSLCDRNRNPLKPQSLKHEIVDLIGDSV
jgi:hypothetical protein